MGDDIEMEMKWRSFVLRLGFNFAETRGSLWEILQVLHFAKLEKTVSV